MMFQKLNPRTNAYVKFKRLPSGKVKILDVKQKNESTPFKGIKIRKWKLLRTLPNLRKLILKTWLDREVYD